MIQKEAYSYESDAVTCNGEIFFDAALTAKRPGILVAHAWRGQDAFAREKAEQLARLGFVALAVDLYGNGATANSNEKAFQLMQPLFLDRRLLRQRMLAAHAKLLLHPLVDPARIGAIGFCFGGLSVIELWRSGAPLKGVVTFHAVIGDTLNGQKAVLAPNQTQTAAVLLLHGYEDPLVTTAEMEALEKEFTAAGVDWQLHVYGQTAHAFTNPEANERGLQYNRKSSQRAWQSMQAFFEEVL